MAKETERPNADDETATQMFQGSTHADDDAGEAGPRAETMKPQDAKSGGSPGAAQKTAIAGRDASATQAPGKVAEGTRIGKPVPAGQTQMAGGEAGKTTASVLGKYRLLKKLGQGGMGAVYKAEDQTTGDIVAIKVLSKELVSKPAFVQRFQREARVMQKIQHENVLTCHDVGEAKGYHYLSMEFVEGGSVEGWLKKLNRFSIGDALYIFLNCARALQHAHAQNLIHRDIKPDNILLTKEGVVKVADLGLAKDTEEDQNLTRTGTGAGTPIYMAPEQARDVKHVDGRVDIYALGVMLYVFLTGEAPFKGATLVEVIAAKEQGKYKPVRQLNMEVPERLDLLIGKMLATKPEHRFKSCQEIIDQIEPLGLHGDQLSFLRPTDDDAGEARLVDDDSSEPAAPAAKTKMAGKPPQPTSRPRQAGTAAPMSKTAAAPDDDLARTVPMKNEAKLEPNVWFWSMQIKGKATTQRLTTDQILGMLKNGSLEPEAQIGKNPKGPFRAVGTFSEFTGAVRDLQTKTKADKKGQAARDKYKEIEAAYVRQQKWKWLKNLFGGGAKGVMGFLWIVIILGLIGGVIWYVRSYHPGVLPF